MSIDEMFKGLIEKVAGSGDLDKMIKTYVPTPSNTPDVDPLSRPPFDIGGPAGQPTGGSSEQAQGTGGTSEAPKK